MMPLRKPFSFMFFMAVLSLTACEQMKDALGITRHQPDEFRVLTRPPLHKPASMNLNAPWEGALSPHMPSPKVQAQQALGIPMSHERASSIEKDVLEKAHVSKDPETVRGHLTEDQKKPSSGADPWAEKLFYWQKKEAHEGDPLDSQKEYERLHGRTHPSSGIEGAN